jgi:hypothetical protein
VQTINRILLRGTINENRASWISSTTPGWL